MRFAFILLVLATPAAAAPSAGKTFSTEADLDGAPGNEKISIDIDGTLTAGLGETSVEYDESDGPRHTTAEVISLGGKRRGIYLVTERQEGEDPPSRHQVFLYEKGSLKLVFNQIIDTQRINFSKKGTGRYVESGWGACTRVQTEKTGPVKRATMQIITLKLDAKATKLVESRKAGTEVQECDQLAACPFVYEVIDGEPLFMGEILRDVRYRHNATLQPLSLGPGTGATIRLTEEKAEITFLDEIYLEVDGLRVPPKACVADPTLAYCAADGRYHVMTIGDVLPLEFDAAPGKRTLFARGYYNPMTAAD